MDFKTLGESVIKDLQAFADTQTDWQIVPNNYEGIRVSCTSDDENGWFLLRLSLHDPVMPLNIESNIQGGVAKIANRLFNFLQPIDGLELSTFKK
jgi:phosphomannomutase